MDNNWCFGRRESGLALLFLFSSACIDRVKMKVGCACAIR